MLLYVYFALVCVYFYACVCVYLGVFMYVHKSIYDFVCARECGCMDTAILSYT